MPATSGGQFEATTDLLKRTVYPPDMVFSGQESIGYIVFPVLHRDVSNFTINVPDMAVRFDYKGDPVETIDLAFKFQREIYHALHPSRGDAVMNRGTARIAVLLVSLCACAQWLSADEWVLGGAGGFPGAISSRSAPRSTIKVAPARFRSAALRPTRNHHHQRSLGNTASPTTWSARAMRHCGIIRRLGIPFRCRLSMATTPQALLISSKPLASIKTGARSFWIWARAYQPTAWSSFPRQEGTYANGKPFRDDFVRKHRISVSDGLTYVNEQPLFNLLRDVPVNPNSVFTMKFPQQFIRFIQLRVGSRSPFEIAEFELYGNGFVPRATYRSQVIDLGEVSNYGTISWAQRALELVGGELIELPAQGQTSVAVRMKTGQDDSPLVHFQKVVDDETRAVSQVVVSEADYNKPAFGRERRYRGRRR